MFTLSVVLKKFIAKVTVLLSFDRIIDVYQEAKLAGLLVRPSAWLG